MTALVRRQREKRGVIVDKELQRLPEIRDVDAMGLELIMVVPPAFPGEFCNVLFCSVITPLPEG
jgi:hypothetical protein